MIRDMKAEVNDNIPVKNVIISVFDKSGLEELIPGLIEANSDVRFMSTGGTYTKIKKILGSSAEEHLIEVAEYTEFPEMEGGLVKTLHPKLHAGILGERNNPEHQQYLKNLGKTFEFVDNVVKRLFDAEVGEEYVVRIVERNPGVFIDMVITNLYPFDKVTADPNVTFETARGNIDIGGPTMIRAAAKNFPSCAVVCDPNDYTELVHIVKANNGCTSFDQRAVLAAKVFRTTGTYDTAIGKYTSDGVVDLEKVRACYTFKKD